jgi:predicted  nucleic acid-binding Zn-ribbon protein
LKLASKWLVIIALIVISLSALVLASTTAFVQDSTGTKDKSEKLFSLLQKANVTVVEILRQFKADGKIIPQASINEYNQALILAEESRSLLQAGSYSEADGKIVQALQKLKEALEIVYTTIPEQPTETEIALERTVQLKSSINRYYEQLHRIENLTRRAANVGYNTTTLEAKIQTIKSLLNQALSNINQNRFETASNSLADAKTLIERISSSLNNFAVDLKIQRIETYINQTETRLDAIRETAESLSNAASLAALDNAETKLNNAKQYFESQRINDTLSEIANSKESEEEAVAYLKPTASSLESTSNSTPNAVQPP